MGFSFDSVRDEEHEEDEDDADEDEHTDDLLATEDSRGAVSLGKRMLLDNFLSFLIELVNLSKT